jgi:3-dehydroquinate synthase class II
MAYTITTSEVLDGFQTSASTADLEGFIAVVDQADSCLSANGVNGAVGRSMKVLGVRHLATNSTERGAVTQERAVSGASRSYAQRPGGQTSYLATLRSVDRYGCVMAIVSQGAGIQLRAAGRRASTP